MSGQIALTLLFDENNEVVQVTGSAITSPVLGKRNAKITDSVKMLAGHLFDTVVDNDEWEG